MICSSDKVALNKLSSFVNQKGLVGLAGEPERYKTEEIGQC